MCNALCYVKTKTIKGSKSHVTMGRCKPPLFTSIVYKLCHGTHVVQDDVELCSLATTLAPTIMLRFYYPR